MHTRAVNEIRVGRHGHNHPRRGNYQKIHERDFDTIVVNPENPPLLFDNLAPKPETWYTTPVPMHTTKKYLSFRGFSYRVEKTISKNNTVAWVCPNPTCESRIITRGYSQIWFDSIDHSHAATKKQVETSSFRKPLEQPKENARKSAVRDSASKKDKNVSFVENVSNHQEAQNFNDDKVADKEQRKPGDIRITRSSEAKKRQIASSPESATQADNVPSSKTRRNSTVPTSSESRGAPLAEPSKMDRRFSVNSSAPTQAPMVWLPNSGESEAKGHKPQEKPIEIE